MAIMNRETRLARIQVLEAQESELIRTGANGRNDHALFRVRRELDTLRLTMLNADRKRRA